MGQEDEAVGMTGSTDQIEQIVTALTGCCAECADRAEHIAYAILEHAPAGLLDNPLSVDIEPTATGQSCTVKHTGVPIFKGVSLEATLTTEAHDRQVAARTLRAAASVFAKFAKAAPTDRARIGWESAHGALLGMAEEREAGAS